MTPKISPEDVAELILVLSGFGWCSASTLCVHTGWSDRKIRAIAHASNGRIISGQNGYKLTSESTVEEVEHAANWLAHQAREMTERAMQIRTAALIP